MKTIAALFCSLIFLLITFSACSATTGDTALLPLQLVAGDTLREKAPAQRPVLRTGHKLIVSVENAHSNRANWSFKIGGLELEQKSVESTGILRFESGAIPDTIKGRAALTFADTDAKVILSPEVSIEILPSSRAPSSNTVSEFRLLPSYDRKKNSINLYFDSHGQLYRGSIPCDIDDNDVINVYFVADQEAVRSMSLDITGSFASDEISVLGIGAVSDLKNVMGELTGSEEEKVQIFPMGTFGPYAPPSITIAIKKKSQDTESTLRTYSLKIVRNYIASIRLGVGKSKLRFNQFELQRTTESDSTHITNTSDPDGEPRPFLTVVFYGWHFWEDGGWWNGRDLTETPNLFDRISPFVGIGLDDIGEEFLLGLSFELARGLDVMWGFHLASTDVLSGGYREGDLFEETEDKLPTGERWKDSKFIGISADLRVAAGILASLLGGGS